MIKRYSLYIIVLIVLGIIGVLLLTQFKGDKGGDSAFVTPISSSSELNQTYSDPDLHFSFKYPDGFTAEASGDSSSRLVLVSAPAKGQEFQLYVTPFGDSPVTVTPERITNDAPGLDMREPKVVSVPGGGQGVSFLSTRSGVKGDVREIWFAVPGHLFQWSAPIGSEATMQAAVSTLSAS